MNIEIMNNSEKKLVGFIATALFLDITLNDGKVTNAFLQTCLKIHEKRTCEKRRLEK